MPGCVAGAVLKVLASVIMDLPTCEKPGLLGADGIHLTKWGKSLFASMLARIVSRALI